MPLVVTPSKGTLSNIARPRSFRFRRARRQLRRRTAVRKIPERIGREEARILLLELLDEIQLQRRGLPCVLRMSVNGVERLTLQVWFTGVVHQLWIERRGVHRRRRASIEDHAPAGRIVQQHHVRRQRDLDPDRRMLGDPARSRHAIVESIVEKERVVRVFDQTRKRILRRECARPVAVAGPARASIAAERLHVEESPTRSETQAGACIRQGRIAIQAEGLLDGTAADVLPNRATIRSCEDEQESASSRRDYTRLHIHGRSFARRWRIRHDSFCKRSRDAGVVRRQWVISQHSEREEGSAVVISESQVGVRK